jgi:hypothetical protein
MIVDYLPSILQDPFKIPLIALQEGVVDEQTTFFCNGFSYGRGRFQNATANHLDHYTTQWNLQIV